MLAGKRFGSSEEVISETEAYFKGKDKSFYKKGESITYRSCEPPYIGGTAKDGPEFCAFIDSLFSPLVDGGLVGAINCNTCSTVECNT